MNRIVLAFRSFFSILFSGQLPADIAREFGYTPSKAQTVAPKAAPQLRPQDGAVQILGILQRDARLVDFLMEDISAYSDEQVGAAVRSLQSQSRDTLNRYLRLAPVIDGVEGSFTKLDASDPAAIKLLGNVPANGKAPGGLLRHKGWRAEKVDLPAIAPGASAAIIAPAEIEVE